MKKNAEIMAKETLTTIENSLRKMKMNYQYDLSGNLCHLIVEGEDIPMPITIWVEPDYSLVVMNSVLPFFVPEEKFDVTMAVLNEINSRIISGVFYLDREDRVIKYKLVDSYLGAPIGHAAIRFNIEILLNTVDKYNDKLHALQEGELDVGYFYECI